MILRSTPWVFATIGIALLLLSGGCGKGTKASSRDAATSADGPAGTGGTASGDIFGTGGGLAGNSGRGGADGGGATTGAGGTASGGAGGSGGAGTGGLAGGGGFSIGGTRTGGISGGGGTNRTGVGGGGAGAGGTGAGGSSIVSGPTCPGVPSPPAGFSLCRTLSDCPLGNNYCMASGPTADDGCAGQLHYVLPAGPQECKLDTDCASGKICVSDGSCVGGGTVCADGCTTTSCGEGWICKSGRCQTASCGTDYTCPDGTICSPGTAGQDSHGCVHVLCTAGYTCPTGSTCQTNAAEADRNGCLGTLCTAGYTCPTGRICSKNAYSADRNGCIVGTCDGYPCPKNQICQVDSSVGPSCARKTCKIDADCDCGVCLGAQGSALGKCYSRLGICAYWSAGGASGSQGGSSGGGGASGSGGAGGVPPPDAAQADAPSLDADATPLCGGKMCAADEACCGPAECGRCVNAMSGIYCPSACSANYCGPSGGACQAKEICVDVAVSAGPLIASVTARCVASPCGSQTLACSCTGTLCSNIDPQTTCASVDPATGLVRCLGGNKCAAPDTPIATPAGSRAIADLRPGDLVYSEHDGALVAVPLVQVVRRPAAGHFVVHIVTARGAVLDISGPHPTADGRRFADLKSGDVLDGDPVVVREIVPYAHAFTYDILPASSTGTYVANGLLIGSTLR